VLVTSLVSAAVFLAALTTSARAHPGRISGSVRTACSTGGIIDAVGPVTFDVL
jgi:hypothetical protein